MTANRKANSAFWIRSCIFGLYTLCKDFGCKMHLKLPIGRYEIVTSMLPHSKRSKKMRQPKRQGKPSAVSGSPKIRLQPNYHSEISETYIAAMQKDVDSRKSASFQLTPISDAGW